MATDSKQIKRTRRHQRIRVKLSGSTGRPRLCVFRSSKHIYAQLVDDKTGRTVASSASNEKSFAADGGAKGTNVAGARKVGEMLARRAAEHGVTAVVFDRAGYRYHGRVKALAEGARSAGLQF